MRSHELTAPPQAAGFSLSDALRRNLEDLEKADLRRTLRVLDSAPSAHVTLDGREVVNFASNNYLGLAGDPWVRRAAAEAAERWGAGATASRLLGGSLRVHEELESALARLKGTEAAAVFPSGYHANLGTLQALLGKDDTAVLDRLAHASLVDGVRLSGARLKVFGHNDVEELEKVLTRADRAGDRCWIITESAFSMDGDVAPLRQIVSLAKRFGANTYVDEAHATGVWGVEGAGVVKDLGLERGVDVCMGTLSKALGAMGGFICGRWELVEWVHNRCRSFIYSTALSPACAASALAALDIVRSQPERREKLFRLGGRLRQTLRPSPASPSQRSGDGRSPKLREGGEGGEGPIVPFIVGSEKAALAISRRLWDAGFFVPAIRPPTVPKGTARLRFSVTAAHSEQDIDRAVKVLKEAVSHAS